MIILVIIVSGVLMCSAGNRTLELLDRVQIEKGIVRLHFTAYSKVYWKNILSTPIMRAKSYSKSSQVLGSMVFNSYSFFKHSFPPTTIKQILMVLLPGGRKLGLHFCILCSRSYILWIKNVTLAIYSQKLYKLLPLFYKLFQNFDF